MGEAGLQDGGANAHGLDVDDLSVAYGSTTVLHSVEFSAEPGHVMGVIGPNGAGKSTLVKTLCGHVRPRAGSVRVAGQRIRPRRERRHLIGLVPQEIGLYAHLSGRENLQVMARLSGVPRGEVEARVEAALDVVDMGARADRRAAHMSGGMQRRINVATAILRDPPLVIFDEPTAGVDHPARDTIHRLTRELAARGHTILIVTHELEEAEALCDRVLVLERGEVRYCAAPATLLASHFGEAREVVVQFRDRPDAFTRATMGPFGFEPDGLPTRFVARTRAGQTGFVSAFVAALREPDAILREVTVRRPGLASLMRDLQVA